MLRFDWLQSHKKQIGWILLLILIFILCLALSSVSRGRHLLREGANIVGIMRESPSQALTIPMEIEAEKNGEKRSFEVVISLRAIDSRQASDDTSSQTKVAEKTDLEQGIASLIDELESTQDLELILPTKLKDGTALQWKKQRDLRFLLAFLLLPICLLYIYETERQQEKTKRTRYEEEIRRALPAFTDQLLLLLNAGLIFHDAFYRIAAGYAMRREQDAFSGLLLRIRREAEETGYMIITIMKNLSKDVGVREYVRMVNMMVDHQHRGVNLEEKLQAESRLLWEGRKAAAMQKGKEMETKMTFPLALLLIVLMIIAGTPALMNM